MGCLQLVAPAPPPPLKFILIDPLVSLQASLLHHVLTWHSPHLVSWRTRFGTSWSRLQGNMHVFCQ
jgi:hypothetical protein